MLRRSPDEIWPKACFIKANIYLPVMNIYLPVMIAGKVLIAVILQNYFSDYKLKKYTKLDRYEC